MIAHPLDQVVAAISTNRATADCTASPVRHPHTAVPGGAKAAKPDALRAHRERCEPVPGRARAQHVLEPAEATWYKRHQA